MTQLQCQKCNYEFDKDKLPKKCPYCSAENSITEYKTAQKWIDESGS